MNAPLKGKDASPFLYAECMASKRSRDGDAGTSDAAADPINRRRAVSDAIRSDVTRRVEENDPEVLLDELGGAVFGQVFHG